MNTRTTVFLALAATLLAAIPVAAATPLKPYLMSGNAPGTLAAKLPEAKEALRQEGLDIVGEYAPYPGAHVLAVTCDELKQAAAKSEFGGYGAALRVSLTESAGKVQVAWNNPAYTANVYRMADSLSSVAAKLEAALGKGEPFGSNKGIAPEKLRKYHYMTMMPYFTDHNKLASSASHAAAVQAVEQGLEQGRGGTAKVYRVDIPGKEEVLFGVAVKEGKGSDSTVMGTCDGGEQKHTPHLPYEILVSGNSAYALHGKFRIALSFPDLGMGTFMKISGAPKAIRNALAAAAGAE